ncbi:recombinase family protein [Endozoicomonas sp. 2B-B]
MSGEKAMGKSKSKIKDIKRCAVYTRKSSEEGLEQEFNSLHAQREAGEAYITSQKQEGWILVPDEYDDGGFSGGNMERPALQRLMKDVEAGKIDVVVVYKVDRLSRSLADFARLVEVFDKHKVSFVAVTQQFNTTSSMGRLTLNILLSFAQFEREVTGERIRDKFLLSKKKGKWMGGTPPLGYDVVDRKLIPNEGEAVIIREIFKIFIETRSQVETAERINEMGFRTKRLPRKGGQVVGSKKFTRTAIYKLLKSRLYKGEIGHKGEWYPGEHKALIKPEVWARAEAILQSNSSNRQSDSRHRHSPSFLRGFLFGPEQEALIPTATRSKGKLHRYYVSSVARRHGHKHSHLPTLPAKEIEFLVVESLRDLLKQPEIIFTTWQMLTDQETFNEDQVREALNDLSDIWNLLFPQEQRRLMKLLVNRIDVHQQGIEIRFHQEGIPTITHELQGEVTWP